MDFGYLPLPSFSVATMITLPISPDILENKWI